MRRIFKCRSLNSLSRGTIHRKFKFPISYFHFTPIPRNQATNPTFHFLGTIKKLPFFRSFASSGESIDFQQFPDGKYVLELQNILNNHRNSSIEEIEQALDQCEVTMTEGLALDLVRRNRSDWKLAHVFFQWVSKKGENSLGFDVYNEILDVLGKMHRFEELRKVFDEMLEREGLVNEGTFKILLHRYAAADKVEDAMGVFNRRKEFGFKDDVVAFQVLLMCLCRYKHVEFAETLYQSKRREFGYDIKTMNIILNGWCVLGNVHEARRMEKVYEILDEMEEKGGCLPNDVTFNYLLKSLKKPEEVPGVLERMERYGCNMSGDTYNLILKLYMKWGHEERVRCTWDEMEKSGLGPDRRSYTIMIHGLYDKGSIEDALSYFNEMTSKGMVPEPRTEILVNAMKDKLKEQEGEKERKEPGKNGKSLRPRSKRRKEKRTG
ncbi:hypothetical protein POUND7_007115 [Theobroma cacao]